MKKKIMSLILALAVAATLCVPSLAADVSSGDSVSEEAVISAIEDGSALVTTEVRDASTYSREEINSDIGLQKLFSRFSNPLLRSAHQFRAVGNVYTTTVLLATGDTAVYRLYPYADLFVTDVGTASSADISTRLYVSESITVNGVLNDTWDNYIRLKNISCSMGCGTNTVFTTNVQADGNIVGLPISNILAMIGLLVDATGYTTTAQIVNALSLIPYDSQSYVSSRTINSANTRAVGLKWKSSITFKDNNDYLLGESSISTKDSSKTANAIASAVGQWNFDVYYGAASFSLAYSGVTLKPTGTYLVNVK